MGKGYFRHFLVIAVALGLCIPATAALTTVTSASGSRYQVEDSGQLLIAKGKKKKGKKGKRKARAKRKKKADPAPEPAPDLGSDTGSGGDDGITFSRRGPARVDFDDRLIQGQTNKSGAIYIFERKSSEIESMVRRRSSFRDEILRSIE